MEEDNPFSKAQTVDPEVRAYVYSLVNALGGSSSDEHGQYVLGDDALACLRDLKRWLKLYDEKTNRLDVARCLAEAKIVTGDLLPILASWPETGWNDKLKSRVALACLELLVPLTWPMETTGEMTVNHHRHMPYLLQAQVSYKAGILSWDTCSVLRQIVRIGLPSIALPRDQRTPRDEGVIKLVLYFFRNVVSIQQLPNLPNQGLDTEVSRSATIEAFRQQDVFAVLLTICSNMGEDFNFQDVIILEILFNLIKGVDARKLWMTEAQRTGQDLSDLKSLLAAENGLSKEAKKTAWSRHGRFGTMIWVKREDEKMSAVSGQDNLRSGRDALFNMDKSKKWNKPQQKPKDSAHTIHDFTRSIHLSDSASEKLRNFVEEFLDSGFNPLFIHLRKAIEREAERLTDVNYRQFFFCVSWFLEAERVRREKNQKEIKPANVTNEFEFDSYSLVAGVLNQETFIMLNRYMQVSLDNKEWQDLNACMRCFTQILLTVQEMAKSPVEEDQEIADNIQNRIFYEETTHDRIVSIVKGYKDQGFGYLDACTELAHVFLRVLERYAKENVDLQIRSRRKARKRQKQKDKQAAKEKQTSAEGESGQPAEDVQDHDDNEDSENEDIADVVQVSKERKFDFTRLVIKFSSQASVNTFIALTNFYRDLTTEQLKRAHRFFYRLAFKQDLAVLLYRVDIIALLYKMIQGPQGLDTSNSMFKEWQELSKQVFRKMFKKINQRPELIVELLFSKIGATLYYLEFGREKQTIAMTRAPAELEVNPASGRDLMAQIGIVVTALINDSKQALVKWVKSELEKAWDKRTAWELEAEARDSATSPRTEANSEDNGDRFATAKPTIQHSSITIVPDSEDTKIAMFKNARLKLLMRLLSFERTSDEDAIGATWTIPGSLSTEKLREFKDVISQYEKSPWQNKDGDGEVSAEDLLRRVRNNAGGSRGVGHDDDENEARRDGFIDDSEGDEDLEEFMFPDNIRQKSDRARNILDELKAKRRKRKRDDEDENGEADEEVLAEKRKARKDAALERRRKIKSELYIRDSDDESDTEKDKEFFRREEELRAKQDVNIRKQMALEISSTGDDPESGMPKTKINARKKQRKNNLRPIEPEDDEDEDSIMADILRSDDPESDRNEDDDNSQKDDETPFTSQDNNTDREMDVVSSKKRKLVELRQPRTSDSTKHKHKRHRSEDVASSERDEDEDEEDKEDDLVVTQSTRRLRAGFIIDSDDDE